jgi:N-acyl homoserine lactone hydrolase
MKDIEVFPIQTGRIFVKRRHQRARFRARGLRFLDAMLDGQFVEIPILAWVIAHPEGVIVVDSGETARVLEPGFFPPLSRWFMQRSFRWNITPEDEIGPQMEKLGFAADRARMVVLTHTHVDHSDGLHHFPGVPVLVSRAEHDALQRAGVFHGAVTSQWPVDLQLELIDYEPESIGPFKESYPLTGDGRVRLIPTPGHTAGHQSVVVQNGEKMIFIAGDSAFDTPGLREGHIDGVSFDARVVNETQQQIRDFAAQYPTVYLPSHDADAPRRLREREVL